MFREDIEWLIFPFFIALLELLIWKKLPPVENGETAIKGKYSHFDQARITTAINLIELVFLIQLFINLLPISENTNIIFSLRISGYFLIITGSLLSILGLRTIGDNWTGMQEYRIKNNQELVTHSIYSKIRHPIYAGLLLQILGFEMVSNSWIILIFVPVFLAVREHIKLEESLLQKHFGRQFITYKNKTKKLLPFIY